MPSTLRISRAQGDVLAFVDDDVFVEPTWPQSLTTDLHSGAWVGAGGRILPEWPCAPPVWLPQKEWFGMAPLVMFDLGGQAPPLNDPPFGTKLAFHRKMFEKYGFFRTDLGPGLNGKIRNNEDTEFGGRLLAAGERLKYEPAAVVHHEVPQKRLQREHFLTWWFNKARSDIREIGVADTKWSVRGIPLSLFRRLAVGSLRWMVTLDPARRFSRRLSVWLVAGMMVESYRQSTELGRKREKLTCV